MEPEVDLNRIRQYLKSCLSKTEREALITMIAHDDGLGEAELALLATEPEPPLSHFVGATAKVEMTGGTFGGYFFTVPVVVEDASDGKNGVCFKVRPLGGEGSGWYRHGNVHFDEQE